MGASCCAQQQQDDESQTEFQNKYKYDPNKQPVKGALHQSKKISDDKKMVKFPTRVRQEADEKEEEQEESIHQDDLGDVDVKSKKSLFTKQKSQFVKAEADAEE